MITTKKVLTKKKIYQKLYKLLLLILVIDFETMNTFVREINTLFQ